MRYITATIGAFLIFLAVFILSGFALAFLPGFFSYWIDLGFAQTNNPLGAIVAAMAATASFRATLKHYREKDRAPAEAQSE
jgi:hypothetical protein